MSTHRAISGTPGLSEWSPFHLGYLRHLLPGVEQAAGIPLPARGFVDDARGYLDAQLRDVQILSIGIEPSREHFRYAPGKWSLREVVGHMADTERILSWRALAAARGDQTNLQPFDENAYVAQAGHDELPLSTLVSELVQVRKSTLTLFATFHHQAWRSRGLSNSHPVSARAWAFAIGAHADLHLATIRNRYLA